MMLPNTICHKIDETSPFYAKGPKEIVRSKFELVVFLEGIVESTGNTVQTKTSYLPREILWGYRFENMVKFLQKNYFIYQLSLIQRRSTLIMLLLIFF